jgi:hypothetical protein
MLDGPVLTDSRGERSDFTSREVGAVLDGKSHPHFAMLSPNFCLTSARLTPWHCYPRYPSESEKTRPPGIHRSCTRRPRHPGIDMITGKRISASPHNTSGIDVNGAPQQEICYRRVYILLRIRPSATRLKPEIKSTIEPGSGIAPGVPPPPRGCTPGLPPPPSPPPP